MTEIFISYRREDASGHANSIYAHLAKRVGASEIFLDTGRMEAGSRWLEETKVQIESCEICLVIIGRHWNTARLKNRDDVVRLELEMALNRKQGIIPVLVDGADLPVARDLPTSLKELPSWQAVWLNHRSYEGYQHDLDTLAKRARALLAQRGRYGIIHVSRSSASDVPFMGWLEPIFGKASGPGLYVSADERISSNDLVSELNYREYFHIVVPVGICSVQAASVGKAHDKTRTDVKTFMIKAGEHKAFIVTDVKHPYWLEENEFSGVFVASKETDGREAQLPHLDDFPHR
jgi:hypothetical protein